MKFIKLIKITIAFAVLVSTFTGLSAAVSAQTTYTTGFESPPFTLGDVNGQNGWGYLSNSPTKGIIETTPAGSAASFGLQSLAIRTNNVAFFGVSNHLYSALVDPAGETGSTTEGVVVAAPYNHYVASFYYRAPATPVISTRADGRFAELNPSSKGTAAGNAPNRYAQVRVFNSTNTAAGTVRFELGWYSVSAATFSVAPIAQNLNWGEWYRLDYDIRLCNGLNGTSPNDIVRVQIYDSGNNLLGTAFGSTWESAWKTGSFGGGTTPRAINGFDFWTQTGPDNALVGYVDNFTQSVDNVANPCLAPTAATVSVGGRVLDTSGRAVSRAMVNMTDATGAVRTGITSPFGYYRFDNVRAGDSYIFEVRHKSYTFAPQVLFVSDELANFDFTASVK
ncbi:MAG TPA: carboxypeptidase-like regulatory domain-containing protein [Pyrinomonadaceae bacterium]